ncbi:GNAT family N-acetyltransferase [Desulfospira joergensenii]|uniref:GNAT family N-acetyltransferase n=1 Tax=Desulfospira joergensenii TaxID=53329 RepID=UPI0003B75978|nr:GNAT family N-acetyltransferase [Desulfospira joergensenii]
MGKNIRISPFGNEQGPALIDLIVHIQQNEFGLPITADDQPDLTNIPEFYQSRKGNFWVAEHGDNVVGSIALLDIGNQMAALRKMFVRKDFRGGQTGTAKKLLQTLISWARAKDVKEIYLGTTPRFLAAHRFYEKNHFIEIEKQGLPESFPIMKVDTKFYQLKL